MDSRTGEPIAKALVSVRAQKLEAITDAGGRFELNGLASGEVELYISTVGYGLMKRRIHIQPGQEFDFYLGQEALKRSDEVTVTAEVFDSLETNAVSEHRLNNSELKNLAGVLVDDPLRSVQALPGVATGDDFNAQFSVRGSGFRSVGFYIDGALMHSPFHSVRDINEGGSLTILNGDLVESVTLLNGVVPAKYGDRTSAVLNVETREGSREKMYNRVNIGAAGLSFTSEGPLGKSKRVSWLISGRRSYLGWLIRRLSEEPTEAVAFDYMDLQGKVTCRLSGRHQINLSALIGDSRVDREREREQLGPNSFLVGNSRTGVVNLNWRWTPSATTLVQSVAYFLAESAQNRNRTDAHLFQSDARHFGLRQDLARQVSSKHRFESGYFLRRLDQRDLRQRFDFGSNQFRPTDQFESAGWQPGFYAQDHWTPWGERLSVTLGMRFDRLSLTRENVWMPRASLSFGVSDTTRLVFAYGQYRQFPGFEQLFGEFKNPALQPERSTQAVFGIEQLLTEKVRIRLEVYDQEESRRIFSPMTEYRLVEGRLLAPQPGNVLGNSLKGYARGVELFVQRRSANGLSGWLSYNYGRSRFHDAISQLAFDGDFDQRHTVNVYGSYRVTETLNLSMKYRYGSNFPIVGFYRSDGRRWFIAEQRNELRVPAYSRLDIRANKAFHFTRWKMTLYGEITNLLARENVRFAGLDGINLRTGQAFIGNDKLLPFLPVGGITLEF
jgi:outer membrane cobalamin receptor